MPRTMAIFIFTLRSTTAFFSQAPDRRVQQVAQPHGHGRRHHFRAFLLEPALDVVVAVAFVRLQPEFAGDLDLRLHLQAVDFDGVKFLAHHAQRIRKIAGKEMPRQHAVFVVAKRPLLEDFEQIIRAFLHHFVGLAGSDLVRTRQVFHVRQNIAAENGPDNAQAQRHIDFQAAGLFGRLVELVLRQEEQAEIFQAHAVERHFVGFVVLAEAAGPASAGRQEDVVIQGLLLAVVGDFGLQEIHQAARGEDRGAAGADVDQFLAGVQVRARDIGQGLRLVVQVVEDALNQPLMFPGQAAEQDRGLVALFPREWSRFIRSVMGALRSP